jgi:hypothetical protein
MKRLAVLIIVGLATLAGYTTTYPDGAVSGTLAKGA